MSKQIMSLFVVLWLVLTVNVCMAASGEENQQLLCAITEVVECDAAGDCLETLPETVGLPDFVMIDLAEQKLVSASGDEIRTTKINAISTNDGLTVIGGMENGHGWSAVLSQENRLLSATISDELAGFVVFGKCMPKP